MKILFSACLMLMSSYLSAPMELNYKNPPHSVPQFISSPGAPVDEVIVESSLYIKPKQKLLMRRSRSVLSVTKNPLNYALPNKILYQRSSQKKTTANLSDFSFYNNLNEFMSSTTNNHPKTFKDIYTRGDFPSFGASSDATQAKYIVYASNRNVIQSPSGDYIQETYIPSNGEN